MLTQQENKYSIIFDGHNGGFLTFTEDGDLQIDADTPTATRVQSVWNRLKSTGITRAGNVVFSVAIPVDPLFLFSEFARLLSEQGILLQKFIG